MIAVLISKFPVKRMFKSGDILLTLKWTAKPSALETTLIVFRTPASARFFGVSYST